MTMTSTEQAAPEHQQIVDARGLACPLPILRAKKALATMASGEVLLVQTTDRGALRTFRLFVARQAMNCLPRYSAPNMWNIIYVAVDSC